MTPETKQEPVEWWEDNASGAWTKPYDPSRVRQNVKFFDAVEGAYRAAAYRASKRHAFPSRCGDVWGKI